MSPNSLLQRLRQLCLALSRSQSPRFSASEVQVLLAPRADAAIERREAVLTTASVPSSWTDYLRRDDARLLGRVAGRLPTIVCLYRAGHSIEEIGRRISVFGGSWLAERALEAAAQCIAARLNDCGMPNVRGAI